MNEEPNVKKIEGKKQFMDFCSSVCDTGNLEAKVTMATLCVNNDILTIFNIACNFVINTKTKHFQHLNTHVPSEQTGDPPPPPLSPKSTPENYFGLLRYCSALSNNGAWYAIADDRSLIVYCTSSWTQKCVKLLERAASKVFFTPSDQSVIVADKTGDVYLFSIQDQSPNGTLLLGHLSILLDALVTADQRYIVTCDRDEKIRVSHFPNAYNIECFCLGHTEFVTKILLVGDTVLASCSGDGTIKFWSFLNGKEVLTYRVYEDVDTELGPGCVITNMVIRDSLLCVSLHKYDNILVYRYTLEPSPAVKLVQRINCTEPLDFALNGPFLWILNVSNDSVLSALQWDGDNFVNKIPDDVQHIVDIVNEECSVLKDSSYIDLSVLYKKLVLREEKVKRLKTE